MKFLTYLILSMSMLFSSLVTAYDLDPTTHVVTDVASGKQWLQWTETRGMSINDDFSSFSGGGWRVASNADMAALFNDFFPSVAWDSDETTTQEFYGQDFGDGIDQSFVFGELFGWTRYKDSVNQVTGYKPVSLTGRNTTYARFGWDNDADIYINTARVWSEWELNTSQFNEAATLDGEYDHPFSHDAFGIALVRDLVTDADNDGIEDNVDNCPGTPNAYQVNSDGDLAGDACDVCPYDLDNDADGDGVCGDVDNCPAAANSDQLDTDGDGFGDVCNTSYDDDGDEWANSLDNCPANPNPGQENSDGDLLGDACDVCPVDPNNDIDGDGFCAETDNCPTVSNADQIDSDGDGLGNACDNDADNDSIVDDVDNCPFTANSDQADDDMDGIGNVCDNDTDNDGVVDSADACLNTALGAVVNGNGCSIAQLCPADGNWKNHGAYTRCVAKTAEGFLESGLISEEQKELEVSSAAQSDVAKKN